MAIAQSQRNLLIFRLFLYFLLTSDVATALPLQHPLHPLEPRRFTVYTGFSSDSSLSTGAKVGITISTLAVCVVILAMTIHLKRTAKMAEQQRTTAAAMPATTTAPTPQGPMVPPQDHGPAIEGVTAAKV